MECIGYNLCHKLSEFQFSFFHVFATQFKISPESKTEKMTDRPHTLDATKSKVPVAYGRNSVSDLASSNDVATNGVYGRTGNKTWCKYECCTPMETSIESACCLEIPEICKPRFLSISCLNVCRSDPHFVL